MPALRTEETKKQASRWRARAPRGQWADQDVRDVAERGRVSCSHGNARADKGGRCKDVQRHLVHDGHAVRNRERLCAHRAVGRLVEERQDAQYAEGGSDQVEEDIRVVRVVLAELVREIVPALLGGERQSHLRRHHAGAQHRHRGHGTEPQPSPHHDAAFTSGMRRCCLRGVLWCLGEGF